MLYVVKGGEIKLESELGRGSCFQIQLPINRDAVRNEEAIVTPTHVSGEVIHVTSPLDYDGNKPTLLLIDDNDDILIYLRVLLKREFNVVTAQSNN